MATTPTPQFFRESGRSGGVIDLTAVPTVFAEFEFATNGDVLQVHLGW